MRPLALIPLLFLFGCPSQQKSEAGEGLPEKPAKRQLDLASKIFSLLPTVEKLGPDAEKDAGLALAQIVVPGYSGQLRLFVAEDHPGVAAGAAKALVDIRLVGRNDRQQVLEQCAKGETIQAMRDECTRRLGPTPAVATGTNAGDKLDSGDAETRRAGLREILARTEGRLDENELGKLVHLLTDSDSRVKILAESAFLRDSLLRNPLPPEPQ